SVILGAFKLASLIFVFHRRRRPALVESPQQPVDQEANPLQLTSRRGSSARGAESSSPGSTAPSSPLPSLQRAFSSRGFSPSIFSLWHVLRGDSNGASEPIFDKLSPQTPISGSMITIEARYRNQANRQMLAHLAEERHAYSGSGLHIRRQPGIHARSIMDGIQQSANKPSAEIYVS
ncbi:hypothetical protein FRC03_001672, partial [Tulasnella sp. 419]